MIKIVFSYMNGTNISRREAQVIYEMKTRDIVVFTPRDVRHFLGVSRDNAYRIINSMDRKGLIERIERGKYILKDVEEGLDVREIVSHLFSPVYIAFWSAMHFHGMTDQVPRKTFVATTKRKRNLWLQGQEIVFVTIKRELFFGYELYGKVIASDREKTIIDCLRQPEYAGGIDQTFDAVDENLDLQSLIEYAKIAKSSAVASRLGYMLDNKGLIDRSDALRQMITTYTKLDPFRGKFEPNSKWKVYVNMESV